MKKQDAKKKRSTARPAKPLKKVQIDKGTFAVMQNMGGASWKVAGYAWSDEDWDEDHTEIWALITQNGAGAAFTVYNATYPHYIGFVRLALDFSEAEFLAWLTQNPQNVHTYVKLKHTIDEL